MAVLIGFDLLDRQIVDRDGIPIGKFDDVELTAGADDRLCVTALLTGQQALGARFGGVLGRWIGMMLSPVLMALSPLARLGQALPAPDTNPHHMH
ncbi:hypothetical protein [Plantactinospora sp. DSM 117369]